MIETRCRIPLRTFTGKSIQRLEPRVEDLDIVDIAHSLSLQCRFAGHIDYHYSVAQHSIAVSELVPREYALHGLLHDAAEAYLQDIALPDRDILVSGAYLLAEERWNSVIGARFGLGLGLVDLPHEVKRIDEEMAAIEMRELYQNEYSRLHGPILATFQQRPKESERCFLRRFEELTKNDATVK